MKAERAGNLAGAPPGHEIDFSWPSKYGIQAISATCRRYPAFSAGRTLRAAVLITPNSCAADTTEEVMLETAAPPADAKAAGEELKLTDGFHLVLDALKLNGLNTIYTVPGIPITDLGRMAQAE